ncbi:hypothetical protein OnM2_072070 [Erysiphe neolycopersici]|uniref:Uncharacterized protein n=1 Tax=Erysiphe neolycopersici TaxID=212602 RepID=A0A420HJR5_9PEZI|nr:hypothetical protein OnM2_072070 [Erysiphe neolycopersici]
MIYLYQKLLSKKLFQKFFLLLQVLDLQKMHETFLSNVVWNSLHLFPLKPMRSVRGSVKRQLLASI